ncbi:hypothetical protein T439DRAFT_294351 [Meredithblackwellia eburnea MCA 4105]
MASRTIKRLLSELNTTSNSEEQDGVLSIGPVSDTDLFNWRATVDGPQDTAFQGHSFTLHISIPSTYPTHPPTMSFDSSTIFHPNVTFKTGEICLDVLKSEWSPIWTLRAACRAVQSLLALPEPSSPLNVDAANLLRCGDQVAFDSLVRMYISLRKSVYCFLSRSQASFAEVGWCRRREVVEHLRTIDSPPRKRRKSIPKKEHSGCYSHSSFSCSSLSFLFFLRGESLLPPFLLCTICSHREAFQRTQVVRLSSSRRLRR